MRMWLYHVQLYYCKHEKYWFHLGAPALFAKKRKEKEKNNNEWNKIRYTKHCLLVRDSFPIPADAGVYKDMFCKVYVYGIICASINLVKILVFFRMIQSVTLGLDFGIFPLIFKALIFAFRRIFQSSQWPVCVMVIKSWLEFRRR